METTTIDRPMKVETSEDVVRVRQEVRKRATEIGLSLVDQTKVVTAASELARNMLDYGGGGVVTIELVQTGGRRGIRLAFVDEGPGIADVERALQNGVTTGGGLGLGLGGAKRLSNEFEIVSAPGKGTKVVITRWK
jgi:serine/threonine-protein kinase RsbT